MINSSTDIITQLINQYTQTFSSYYHAFLNWGNWLFYSFSTIAIVWICLWREFERNSLSESLPSFLKEFFLIAFFYTIMINAGTWLASIVDTAQTMSQQLTHQSIDPASIIQQGLTIANRVLSPLKNSAALTHTVGAVIIITAYLITLLAFIVVAIHLAVTFTMTTFLVVLSAMSLAFGSFAATRRIALRTLDAVTAYSFKLLTLSLVINAGAGIFKQLAEYLPLDQVDDFDVYGWVIAATLLFAISAYYLPRQILRLFNNSSLICEGS
jgi:P-type conjugative transfer protein TrbL